MVTKLRFSIAAVILAGLLIFFNFAIFIELLIWLVVIAGILFYLAKVDTIFTFVETGDIKFVVEGKDCVKVLTNIPGKTLNKSDEIVDIDNDNPSIWGQTQPFFLGMYFLGLPFVRSIHKFDLIREWRNERITKETPVKDWIISEQVKDQSSLRHAFPRPILASSVEFADQLEADILVLVDVEVISPKKTIFKYKGNFHRTLGDKTEVGISQVCSTVEWDQFIKKEDKTKNGRLSKTAIVITGDDIEQEMGLRVTGFSFVNQALTSEEARKIVQQRSLSNLQGDADIKAAEKRARVIELDAEAAAKADSRRAVARVADVGALMDLFGGRNVDPNIATRFAASIARAQRFAGVDSKLTVLVDGGGANVSLPIPASPAGGGNAAVPKSPTRKPRGKQ